MAESKKPVSPKSALAVLVIAALLYGGNLVREKWFGGTSPTETTDTNTAGKKKANETKNSADRTAANKDATAAKKRDDKPAKTATKSKTASANASKKSVAKAAAKKTPAKNTSSKKTPSKTSTAKKPSRFSQDRKPRKKSRFSQNRVGRGAPAVNWGGIDEVKRAFAAKRSDVFIEVTGVVVHILPLDTIGKRHQNFLFKLANNITLKVSHNIDLAPMIPNLRKGMKMRIRGEYEYNDKGGVLHWTHHDPARRHPDGWIEVNGKKYG